VRTVPGIVIVHEKHAMQVSGRQTTVFSRGTSSRLILCCLCAVHGVTNLGLEIKTAIKKQIIVTTAIVTKNVRDVQ